MNEEMKSEGRTEDGDSMERGRLTAVTCVTEAPDVLHRVPRKSVVSARLCGKVLLRPACSTVVAVLRAHGALAGNTIVAGEACTGTSLAITHTLVGAFCPGMDIVGADNVANPGVVLGASPKRAIGARPLGLARVARKALAVGIHLARPVIGAVVFAKPAHSVTLLVRNNLSPCFLCVRRC